MERSIKEANDLMELSQEQLEVMRRQADQALEQAERMNDLLARVVKLTEPLEKAQRGGEYVGGRLKKAIFGPEPAAARAADRAKSAQEAAEGAAEQAESAADHAEVAAEYAEEAVDDAEEAAEEADEAVGQVGEPRGEQDGGIEVTETGTIRVIPNRPPPGESET